MCQDWEGGSPGQVNELCASEGWPPFSGAYAVLFGEFRLSGRCISSGCALELSNDDCGDVYQVPPPMQDYPTSHWYSAEGSQILQVRKHEKTYHIYEEQRVYWNRLTSVRGPVRILN